MQAQELDDLVQRLAVASYALAAHDEAKAREAVDEALALARRLMTAERGATMVRTRAAD